LAKRWKEAACRVAGREVVSRFGEGGWIFSSLPEEEEVSLNVSF